MKNKIRVLTICGVIIVVLITAYVYISSLDVNDSEPIPDPSPIETMSSLLIDESSNELMEVEMISQQNISYVEEDILSQQSIAYVKEDGRWVYKDRKELPIKQAIFIDFSNNFSRLERNIVRKEPSQEEILEFGLNNYSEGKLTYSNGNSYLLKVGHYSPSGNGLYFMIDDDPTIYLDSGQNQLFLIEFDQFLDVDIDFPNLREVKKLVWSSKNGIEYEIVGHPLNEDDSAQKYHMTKPIDINIVGNSFRTRVINSINNFAFIQGIVSFDYTDGINDFGFEEPNLNLFIEDFEGKTLNLTIGNELVKNGYFAKYNDRKEVYIFTYEGIEEFIDLNIITYVDKQVFSYEKEDIKMISLVRDEDEYFFEPSQSENTLPKINFVETEEDSFIDIFSLIVNISYDTVYVEENKIESDIFISINVINNNDEVISLVLYDYDDNFYLIKTSDEIFGLVNKKYINKLLDTIDEYSANLIVE